MDGEAEGELTIEELRGRPDPTIRNERGQVVL